jgi:membrane protein
VDALARRLHGPPAFWLGVVRSFFADDGITWSAGIAFYLVLSIPPLLIGLGALAHLVTTRDDEVATLVGRLSQIIPGEGQAVLQLATGRGHDVAVAGVLAVGWILVSGSRIFGVLTASIEGMWDVPRRNGLIERELLRFGLLAGALVVVIVASLVSAWAGDLDGPSSPGRFAVWLVGAQLVPLVLVAAALTTLYLILPPRKAGVRAALLGAVVATVLLRVVEFGFIAIFATSPGWESVYGPLAGVAVLMTWALAAAASIVVGAEVVILVEQPERLQELGIGAPGEENRSRERQRRDIASGG